jgi:nitrogen-specific signal transduction histidine kinase/ActR/RegA family two-component response regulator
VQDAHGETAKIVGVAEDVTNERDLEARLLRTQRLEAIGTLSSGIAHDLNNILAPMLMATGLLRSEATGLPNRELIDMIESGAQRGANIIRQLLTFSRGIEGERAAVQPRHIINEMAAIARETFPRNIVVGQDVARELSLVSADATQLHQVLMNVCVNARDAMPDGGALMLSGHNVELRADALPGHPDAKPGRHVCIAITDNGHGIPAGVIDRIFEPFFTTKSVGKGTGLGLSTVLGIVKSHGGFVTVDSAPGRGATFSLYLPALETSATVVSSGAAESPLRGAGQLILVVDDEGSIRDVASAALRQWNYRALTAGDGEQGLALFLQHRSEVKLVLVDLMMPVMGGSTLIRKLWEYDPALKVIAMSGMMPEEQRAELVALKVNEPLMKPFASEDLLARIARALSGPGGRT